MQDKKLPSGVLSMEELYKQYNIQLQVDMSKKIMLGLMIYQGITVSEFMRLEASYIQLRLKQYNLRQVQYMAGHKYVSNTERYQTSNPDELKNELQQHHPMK